MSSNAGNGPEQFHANHYQDCILTGTFRYSSNRAGDYESVGTPLPSNKLELVRRNLFSMGSIGRNSISSNLTPSSTARTTTEIPSTTRSRWRGDTAWRTRTQGRGDSRLDQHEDFGSIAMRPTMKYEHQIMISAYDVFQERFSFECVSCRHHQVLQNIKCCRRNARRTMGQTHIQQDQESARLHNGFSSFETSQILIGASTSSLPREVQH